MSSAVPNWQCLHDDGYIKQGKELTIRINNKVFHHFQRDLNERRDGKQV